MGTEDFLPSRTPRQPPSFLTGSQPGGRISPPRVRLSRSLALPALELLLLNVPPKPSSSLFWTLPTWNCHPHILQHCTSPTSPQLGPTPPLRKPMCFKGNRSHAQSGPCEKTALISSVRNAEEGLEARVQLAIRNESEFRKVTCSLAIG